MIPLPKKIIYISNIRKDPLSMINFYPDITFIKIYYLDIHKTMILKRLISIFINVFVI